MNPDVKFAEALTELRRRLEAWGIEDAATKAHDFMRDLTHQGWRPSARPIETSPPNLHRASDDAVHAYAEQARRLMAEAKTKGESA